MADRKMMQKYDPAAEAEVRGWIQQLCGEHIGEGQWEMEKALKNGVLLCRLMQKLFAGTPNLPPKCKGMNVNPSNLETSFKQMENIEKFLKASRAYGVPDNGLFACVDLFEGRNMPMVLSTILQVGSEAQRNKFSGPTCGPKPVDRQKKKFTRSQLRAGQTIIGIQSGTNKFATQKGMSFGSTRHGADIRADDLHSDSNAEIGLQAGTNKFASQKGMSFGAVRHVSDIKVDDACTEGMGMITLQAGTNQYASQKGMRGGFGSVRHVSDIRADDAVQEGAAEIGLQAGTNKFASQKGMSFGAVRHVADIRADDMTQEASGVINLQAGWNKGASQSGMRGGFGAVRHVSDIKVTELYDDEDVEDDEEEYGAEDQEY